MFPFTLRKTKGSPLTHDEMDTNFEKSLFPPFLHIQDQKPQGTNGGTFTSGAWRTRDLNTVLTNTIPGASLSNNQITLPAGKYYVEASAPSYIVSLVQLQVYDITNTSILLLGSVTRYLWGGGTTSPICGLSLVSGIFQSEAEIDLELRHQCSVTNDANGFGVAANFTTEVYSDIRIWRIGDVD